MQSDSGSVGRRSGTFIEAARRAQIIEAAIIAVNEHGYAGASLSVIAARAETSKSVISYHFDGKEELLAQVVEQVYGEVGELIVAAVDAADDWPGKLAAYVRAELGYVRDHRERILAANEIVISHRDADGTPLYLQGGDEETALLEHILQRGRRAKAFAPLDVKVAAVTIVHAIDGAITESQRDPGLDLDRYGDRLIPLLLRAVGAA
ncbi:TetR/AcrR family transcriptional regulator [Microlunatus parietis]|uniref:AcrR family transcriptional regulator n=1 Tax=Microlunatus parietis TaxID=682979 RepID=A0A7Y9IBP7_9ACTN|nr:TetR/AcrR family transcriptional regulator [Microlunatus parietis]NYE73914.1 AcrR family transcriptional regulator [Microlunatus parietis]